MPILTTEYIDSLPPAAKVQAFYWDEKVRGFGVKVMESGRKIFMVQYRTHAGIARRYLIGDFDVLEVEAARERAMELLREVALGGDPMAERSASRGAMTMRELCEQYMEKHARIKKKPRSIKQDQYLINRFILPELGERKITDIERGDIHQLHFTMRDTPVQANHVIQVLKAMFNLAEKWGWRKDHTNPVRHVEQYPVIKRTRYLTMEELVRLNEVLAEGREPHQVIAAFRLLILTGCRLGEIQTLKWDYVDFERHCLRLPDSKTGAKDVLLGAPALEVLKGITRQPDNPYVIYGALPGKYYTDMQGAWERLRKRAGIEDVRIHDLRHTFASVAVNMGEALPIIGKLLGHSEVRTTERYAHVAITPQQQAANRIASNIAEMMASGIIHP